MIATDADRVHLVDLLRHGQHDGHRTERPPGGVQIQPREHYPATFIGKPFYYRNDARIDKLDLVRWGSTSAKRGYTFETRWSLSGGEVWATAMA
jgi:hypothetical protein